MAAIRGETHRALSVNKVETLVGFGVPIGSRTYDEKSISQVSMEDET